MRALPGLDAPQRQRPPAQQPEGPRGRDAAVPARRSAAERLAADRAKYLRGPRGAGPAPEGSSPGPSAGAAGAPGPPAPAPAPAPAPGAVARRTVARRPLRPDSLVIYRQKRDFVRGQGADSPRAGLVRKLFPGPGRDRAAACPGTARGDDELRARREGAVVSRPGSVGAPAGPGTLRGAPAAPPAPPASSATPGTPRGGPAAPPVPPASSTAPGTPASSVAPAPPGTPRGGPAAPPAPPASSATPATPGTPRGGPAAPPVPPASSTAPGTPASSVAPAPPGTPRGGPAAPPAPPASSTAPGTPASSVAPAPPGTPRRAPAAPPAPPASSAPPRTPASSAPPAAPAPPGTPRGAPAAPPGPQPRASRRGGLRRSQSDLSSRYSASLAEFDTFFQFCGLDPEVLDALGRENFSAGSDRVTPRVRSVSVATSDSGFSRRSGGQEGLQEEELTEQVPSTTSVVERNARIIKWLYTCKRAKETPGQGLQGPA